jgi:hypothetical protein
MAHYRCNFVDRRGRFIETADLDADTDERAIDLARTVAARTNGHPNGFEIWQEQRLVFTALFFLDIVA